MRTCWEERAKRGAGRSRQGKSTWTKRENPQIGLCGVSRMEEARSRRDQEETINRAWHGRGERGCNSQRARMSGIHPVGMKAFSSGTRLEQSWTECEWRSDSRGRGKNKGAWGAQREGRGIDEAEC